MDLKDIFQNSVLNEIQEQNKKKSLTSQYEREVASAKKKQLAPVQEFLQMFVDSQIYVKHCDYYTSKNHEPQLFSFFLGDSSKSWSPGVSIFIEHPEIEIAIPNNKHDGQIVIFISSHHPDSFLISQKFTTMESAIKSLGSFLGRCVVKIDKPQATLNSQNKSQVESKEIQFFQNIPLNPRKTENQSHNLLSKIFSEKQPDDNEE